MIKQKLPLFVDGVMFNKRLDLMTSSTWNFKNVRLKREPGQTSATSGKLHPKFMLRQRTKIAALLNCTSFTQARGHLTFANRTIRFILHAALARKKLIMKTGS